MTMPNSRLLKNTELILLAAGCAVAYVVLKHVKNESAPRRVNRGAIRRLSAFHVVMVRDLYLPSFPAGTP